ncbi:MAG: DUF3256 family protein [Muribaculaceae bacterium]|nr:DUF3256 family protein [Muribaculaceae bacterium]
MVCLVVYATGYAGVKESGPLTASKVFAEIPLEVLDMIRPSTRLDMLDYYNQADSLIIAQDALGGQCRLEQVSDDYLKVSVTPISTLEIKLLPYKKDMIIMTLYTVADDSVISFLDSDLNPLPSDKFFRSPDLQDFFNLKNSGISVSELKEKIPFESIVYSSGPGETPLTAKFTTLSVLSKEDRDILTPLLIPSLTSIWKGKFQF